MKNEEGKEPQEGCPAQTCPNGYVWDSILCRCVEDIGGENEEKCEQE